MSRSVLYLHGFASGPKSYKKEQVKEIFDTNEVSYPQLSPHPEEALQQIEDEINKLTKNAEDHLTVLAGTSLGGFYAMLFALRYELPAFVYNPANDPSLFEEHIGINERLTDGSKFTFTKEDYIYLRDKAFPQLYREAQVHPERSRYLFITFNQDDETVSHDFKHYKRYFPHAKFEIFPEGGHGFPDLTKSNLIQEIDLSSFTGNNSQDG